MSCQDTTVSMALTVSNAERYSFFSQRYDIQVATNYGKFLSLNTYFFP